MKKRSSLNGKLLYFLSFALVLFVIGYLLYIVVKTQSTLSPRLSFPTLNPTKTYTSRFLKMKFNAPINYTFEEQFGSISLTTNNGTISINRHGSYFDNINQHLTQLSELNNLNLLNNKSFKIDDYPAVRIDLQGKNSKQVERVYFIYPDPNTYTIYSFSTDSPALYADLDAIVNSYRYAP